MSFAKIEKAISIVKQINNWNLYLMEYNHKTKPNEYTFYDFHFDSNDLLINTINSMCDAFMKIVEKYDKKVIDYTADNPKNVIDKININNALITNNWYNILNNINGSTPDIDLKSIKANAFMFMGTYTSNNDGMKKRIYLLTVKNPILNFKKRTPVFKTINNKITIDDEPLVQFKKYFDVIVYDGILYAINSSFENTLNMEYSHKIVCREKLDLLNTAEIVLDMDSYRVFATSSFYPKKFTTYNEAIVEKLKHDEWKMKLSTELKIPIDPTTKKFDLSEPNNAKNFTLAICDKTKFNMFDDGVCEVSSSTPILFT